MNSRCTTAAFTLSPVPGGLRHLVLTRPETEPSMRFLFVGSHRYGLLPCRPPFGPAFSCSNSLPANLCAQASFRQFLTELPLPSASGYIGPKDGHFRYSHRGLSPHQFMPMSGVHTALQGTKGQAYFCAAAGSAHGPLPLSLSPVAGATPDEEMFHGVVPRISR